MNPSPNRNKQFLILGSVIGLTVFLLGFQSRPISGKSETKNSKLQPGLTLDPFELFESVPKKRSQTNQNLPTSVDLSQNFPPPGDQGNTKNSVGFAVGYGLISYYEAQKKNYTNLSKISISSNEGQANLYSANYIYSQLNGGKDQGASLLLALILAESRGSVSLEANEETLGDFRSRPKPNLIEQGRKARLSRIYRLEPNDFTSIKHSLSEGHPVCIGYLVYENFLNAQGEDIYEKPTGVVLGAQSLVILGYSDKKRAFRVWNSWGKDWGDKGYLWISYDYFPALVRSAYIVQPRSDSELIPESKLVASLSKISYLGNLIEPPKEVYASRGDFSDRVRVSWSKQKYAIGYEIYRKRKSESKYQLVGLSRQSYFEDFGVQKAIAYSYRVSSLDETYISDPSSDSNDGYSEDPPKSGGALPITNLTASVTTTNDRIVLEWDSQPSGTKYSIYKWNPSSKIYRFLGRTEKSTYTDFKAARNGDSEIYQVIAERNAIVGEKSSYVSAHLDPMEILKPRPKNLTASKGMYPGQIVLNWEGSPAALRYIIYRKTQDNWIEIGKTTETQFKDDKVNDEITETFYSVIAEFEEKLFSLPSEVDSGYPSFVAKRAGSPEPPNLVEVFEYPKESKIHLTWSNVPKVKDYKVYFRKKSEKEWVLYKEVKTNSVYIPNLSKNQFYFFSVQSVITGIGESRLTEPKTSVLTEPTYDLKKVKTFGESNIQKFVGPWTAMYWDGKNKVKPVRLSIDADETGNNVVMKWNETEIYRGQNIIDSDQIEEKGKWKIQLSPTSESLTGEFQDKGLVPEKSQLSFVRE